MVTKKKTIKTPAKKTATKKKTARKAVKKVVAEKIPSTRSGQVVEETKASSPKKAPTPKGVEVLAASVGTEAPKTVPKKPAAAKAAAGKKEEAKVILRIHIRAYENKILDASVKQIMDTALRYDAEVVGPVPLPTEIKKYTVNRSPFVFKDSREQFEIRTHKRLIDILNPAPKTIEALTNLSLPSGVYIDVKMM